MSVSSLGKTSDSLIRHQPEYLAIVPRIRKLGLYGHAGNEVKSFVTDAATKSSRLCFLVNNSAGTDDTDATKSSRLCFLVNKLAGTDGLVE